MQDRINHNTPPCSEHPLILQQCNEAQEGMEERELHFAECLCTDVSDVVSRCYGPQGNGAIGHTFMHIMMSDINVFGVAVVHRVLGK